MSDELTTLAFQASQAASRYLRAAERYEESMDAVQEIRELVIRGEPVKAGILLSDLCRRHQTEPFSMRVDADGWKSEIEATIRRMREGERHDH